MGAGAIFLLFVLAVVVVLVGGAVYAIRAGLWVRETSPKATDSRDEGRPEHVEVEDEGDARFDVPGRRSDVR
jgi:hypothetical protein